MTEQLRLQGTPAPTHRLTDRQQYAYDVIAEEGPISSSALGAYMHDRRGKHRSSTFCLDCKREGLGVAKELRAKKDERGRGLVKQSRLGWVLTVRRPAPTDVDPFPAGY